MRTLAINILKTFAVLILILLTYGYAYSQNSTTSQAIEAKLKAQIAELVWNNTILLVRVEELEALVKRLQVKEGDKK